MSAIGASNFHSIPISKKEDRFLLAANSEKSTSRKVYEMVAKIFAVIGAMSLGLTLYAAFGLMAAPVTVITVFSTALFATVASAVIVFAALYFRPSKKEGEKVLPNPQPGNITSNTFQKKRVRVNSGLLPTPVPPLLSSELLQTKKEEVLPNPQPDNITSNTFQKEIVRVNSGLLPTPVFVPPLSSSEFLQTKEEEVLPNPQPDNIASNTFQKEIVRVNSGLLPTPVPPLSSSELLEMQWRECPFTNKEFKYEAFFDHLKGSSNVRDWTQKILKETEHMSIAQIAKTWPEIFSQKVLQKTDILEKLQSEVAKLTSFEQITLSYPESFFELEFLTKETPGLEKLVQNYLCFKKLLLKPVSEWPESKIVKYHLMSPAFQAYVEEIQLIAEKENILFLQNQKNLQEKYNEQVEEKTKWYQATSKDIALELQILDVMIEPLEQRFSSVTKKIKRLLQKERSRREDEVSSLQGQSLETATKLGGVKKDSVHRDTEIRVFKAKLVELKEESAAKQKIATYWINLEEGRLDLPAFRKQFDEEKQKISMTEETAYEQLLSLEKERESCSAMREKLPPFGQLLFGKSAIERPKIEEKWQTLDRELIESKKAFAENLKNMLKEEENRYQNALSFLVDNFQFST
jgi:hypothetical protein